MKLLFLILLSSTLHAQSYRISQVITEKVDTVHNGRDTIYVYKNGSAWIVSPGSVEFMGKRNYRRWERKHKNQPQTHLK